MKNAAIRLALTALLALLCAAPAVGASSRSILSRPQSLAVTAHSSTSLTLTWHYVRYAQGYTVSLNGAVVGAPSGASWTYKGLACGTSYSLGVAARSRTATSPTSTIVASTDPCAPAPAVDATSPSAPGALSVSGVTETGATVGWAAATDNVGVTGYRVSVDGAAAVVVTGLSYSVTGLQCGTSHGVSVSAYDAAGNSGPAAAVQLSTSACAAPAPPPQNGPAPPASPSSYALPPGATVVSTSSQLASALAAGTADIVLADGTYASSEPFTDAAGSRLYAQHLGKAVLTAGLVVGGNAGSGGAVVQGLAFDVASSSLTLQGGEVTTWGAGGASLHVLDCAFQGNKVVPMGLYAYNPSGLVAQRLTFANFTDEAVRASDNATTSYGGSTATIASISDVSVDGVTRSTPGSSNGTAEAGLWIGEPVVGGVHRIKIRNVSWSGIETVNNAWNTAFTDLDIDMSGPNQYVGVGVYMEHFSWYDTFSSFRIVGASLGFKAEWDDPAWGGVAAGHHVTIENGLVDATGWSHGGHTAGVFLDEGTEATTITGVTFANQSFAAIDAFNTAGANSFTGNSYQLASGAAQLSTGHI